MYRIGYKVTKGAQSREGFSGLNFKGLNIKKTN